MERRKLALKTAGHPLCEIQWVSAESDWKPTPDDNEPVGFCELIAIDGKEGRYATGVPQRPHAICAEHLRRIPLNGTWLFGRIFPEEDKTAVAAHVHAVAEFRRALLPHYENGQLVGGAQ